MSQATGERSGTAERARPRRPHLTLNTDGQRHPLENVLTLFTLVAGLVACVSGFMANYVVSQPWAHIIATWLGLAALLVGLYSQLVSATRVGAHADRDRPGRRVRRSVPRPGQRRDWLSQSTPGPAWPSVLHRQYPGLVSTACSVSAHTYMTTSHWPRPRRPSPRWSSSSSATRRAGPSPASRAATRQRCANRSTRQGYARSSTPRTGSTWPARTTGSASRAGPCSASTWRRRPRSAPKE